MSALELDEDRYFTEWRQKMRGFAKGALFGKAGSVVSISDVLQESLLQLWQSAGTLENMTDRHTHSWVYRVVKGNIAKVHRYFGAKKRSSHSELANIDVGYEPAEPVDDLADKEELALIALAMEMLPRNQQMVLHRYIFENQTFAEISRETGISASQVRRVYLTAVGQLQSLFFESNV